MNPRRMCEDQVAYLGPLGRVKLNTDKVIQDVAGLFQMDSKVLKSMDESCADEVMKADTQATDAAWIRGYAVVAFAKKWAAFEDHLKIMLSLRQQFDMQNPEVNLKPLNCEMFHSASLKAYCQGLASCLAPEQRAQAFEAKAHTLFRLIERRQFLKQQPTSDEVAQNGVAAIEAFPFLKSEAMAKYISSLDRQVPDENAVKDAMKAELHSQQAKVDERLNQVNHSFDCLMGYTDKNCGYAATDFFQDKVESVYLGLMSESPQRISVPGPGSSADQRDLGQISQLQSCMADWAGEVAVVSSAWNNLVSGGVTALLPTPQKLVALSKAGATLKTMLWGATKATAIGAAKIGAAAMAGRDAYNKCSDLSEDISQNSSRFRAVLRNNLRPMSCDSAVEQLDLSETSDWCSLHYALAILPVAKESEIGLKSLKYLRSIPIPDVLSKIRLFGAKNAVTAGRVFSEIDPAFASSKFYSAEAKVFLETEAAQLTKMSELAERVGLPSNASASEVQTALRKLQSKYYTDFQRDLTETDFNLLSAVRSKLNGMNAAWKRIQAGAEIGPAPAGVPRIGGPSTASTGT
jgi:hypothetical protein